MEPVDTAPPSNTTSGLHSSSASSAYLVPHGQSVKETAENISVTQPVSKRWLSVAIFRDYQFWNVIGVSIAFMILFSSFHTCGMLQASVLSEVHDEYFNGTGKEGYYSSAAIYTVMAISNWIAPSVIAYTGPKYGMFIGGIPYCLFMAVFFRPYLGTLYASSVLLGIGAAILWTSQGVFLTINSTDQTMSRNAGMFWAILQLSNLWGNIFATVELSGQKVIDSSLRVRLFIGLLCAAILGVLLFGVLRYPGKRDRGRPTVSRLMLTNPKKARCSCTGSEWTKWAWIREIRHSFRLLLTLKMLLLSVTFAYTGFMLTFYSGVFGTSIHSTKQFGEERNYLLGLSGVIIGIGEITSGALFGFLGSAIKRRGRSGITVTGVVLQLISYLLIFLFFPFDSPAQETDLPTYVTPNKHIAFLCSFMLGFGDAAINIQIYALLGNTYSADSAPAFALYKFVQSVTAAIAFFYASIILPGQLAIVTATGIFGAASFCLVELLNHKEETKKQAEQLQNMKDIK